MRDPKKNGRFMRAATWIAMAAVVGFALFVVFGPFSEYRTDSSDGDDVQASDASGPSESVSADADHAADAGSESEATDSNAEGENPGDTDLNWEEIDDVDALARSLAAALEDGNGLAGWKLHRLAATCLESHMVPAEIPAERQSRMTPEQLAEVQARLDRLNTMKGPCQDSSLGDIGYARSVKQEALWEAAQSGHLDSKYRLVFRSYMPGNEPMPSSDEKDMTWQTARREQLNELREACHDRALASIGIHLSRDSDVADGLVRESLEGHDASTSRQIQAFAHRYAAAVLQNDEQPARSARNEDYPLSAHEEQRAVAMGESIVNGCD